MDRRERGASLDTAILTAIIGQQAAVWTAMPGLINSYDAAKGTCSVQPTIQALVRDPAGVESWVAMPLLVDCPVVFPSGGGFTLTFPIAAGDECLVVFASRCIDAWWQSGGVQVQADMRMHDLSDGFVMVGPRSQPRALASPSTTDVVLRNDAGTSFVSVKSNGDVAVTSPTAIVLTAPSVTIDSPSVFVNNKQLVGHVHTGVRGGSDLSGPQP